MTIVCYPPPPFHPPIYLMHYSCQTHELSFFTKVKVVTIHSCKLLTKHVRGVWKHWEVAGKASSSTRICRSEENLVWKGVKVSIYIFKSISLLDYAVKSTESMYLGLIIYIQSDIYLCLLPHSETGTLSVLILQWRDVNQSVDGKRSIRVLNAVKRAPFNHVIKIFTSHCWQTFTLFLFSSRALDFSSETRHLSDKKNFELKGYAFTAAEESLRTARIVRVGLIQNKIVLPTTAPVPQQV